MELDNSSSMTTNLQQIPRNVDAEKKLNDPLYHQKMDWIKALEKDFPEIPYYFLDLITSYVQAHPDEADDIMNGNIDLPEAMKLTEWRKNVKSQE